VSNENAHVLGQFLARLAEPTTARDAFTLVADDFVAHEPVSLPYGGEHHGADGFRKLLGAINRLFLLEVKDLHVRGCGDIAFADVDMRFTSQANGQVLDTRVVELYTIRDGKIAGLHVFYQDTKAMTALCR